ASKKPLFLAFEQILKSCFSGLFPLRKSIFGEKVGHSFTFWRFFDLSERGFFRRKHAIQPIVELSLAIPGCRKSSGMH
ncbi:MAG: hypothetical protein K5945_06330, partial [Bacteroidaceae bacterium]|nr:hypothetical protein [Bacteroidaceae bacterium]